ncbi:MAG: phytanoyl-CoA dioxygenase family protein [Halioglobus sp.]
MKAFYDSSPHITHAGALRERFFQDGYLYIPGLMDRGILTSLRRQIVEICERSKWLKPGTNPMDAISWTVPKVEGEEDYFEVYDQVQRLQDFHALPHHQALGEVMRALLGPSAFPHPLSIARLVFPDNQDWSTPPHQDFPNNQGTSELYASWIPLSDCPGNMGPLAILEGSNRLGLLPLEFSLGDGHRQASLPAEAQSLDWVGGDFTLGDVIIFHSHTVHRALPNNSERMRLSVDYRFQAEGEDITESCLTPHCNRQSWSDIYANWDREELKYYWQHKRVNRVPWNDSYGRLPDSHMREAVKLEKGYNRRREALSSKYCNDAGTDQATRITS